MMELEVSSFDHRAESLRQVGDVITTIAVHHAGLRVDETTHERWCQLMGLMRELDTLTDTQQLGSHQSMRALETENSPFAARYPALFPDQIDHASYRALIERARSIFELGRRVATAGSVTDFVSYRSSEARQAAGLLSDSATPFVREQPAFMATFMPLAWHCAISANFYDSFADSRRDYRLGQLRVRPDLAFHLRVGVLSVRHFVPVAKVIFHPAVVRAFAPMAVYGITNKLRFDPDGNPRLPGRGQYYTI